MIIYKVVRHTEEWWPIPKAVVTRSVFIK